MVKIQNYINGKYVNPVGERYFDNLDPSIGKPYSLCADSDTNDVNLAVEAAERAFPEWAALSAESRSKIFLEIASGIENALEELALAESMDNGKTLTQARNLDIPRSAANFRFYGTAIPHFASEAHLSGQEAINYTMRKPVGVVGCISPWNLPLYLFTWKIAPALAAGCCVVAKPSELSPMTASLLGRICTNAGLPPGVLNIVQGTGPKVGQAIVEHPSIRAISFTGGTATGRKIAATAAPMFKKTSLELGGKNPNLIFADCDFDLALETTLKSSFSNQGEICLCGSRIFVERSLYDRFLGAFVSRVKELKTGDPLEPSTYIGALISEAHLQKVQSYIELAKSEGGTIVTGGERVFPEGRCKEGYYITPTIIAGLSAGCRTNQEEIFGPVVTIMPFDTEEEVIAWSNSTPYGLAATLWTQDVSRIHRITAALQSGIIWVNCWLYRDLRTPFGGMKQSGVGREGGWDAMRFFMDVKNICIRYS